VGAQLDHNTSGMRKFKDLSHRIRNREMPIMNCPQKVVLEKGTVPIDTVVQLIFFFFFFCRSGVWAQDFTLAKQVLYHLSYTERYRKVGKVKVGKLEGRSHWKGEGEEEKAMFPRRKKTYLLHGGKKCLQAVFRALLCSTPAPTFLLWRIRWSDLEGITKPTHYRSLQHPPASSCIPPRLAGKMPEHL
jgi:hypothetical protein